MSSSPRSWIYFNWEKLGCSYDNGLNPSLLRWDIFNIKKHSSLGDHPIRVVSSLLTRIFLSFDISTTSYLRKPFICVNCEIANAEGIKRPTPSKRSSHIWTAAVLRQIFQAKQRCYVGSLWPGVRQADVTSPVSTFNAIHQSSTLSWCPNLVFLIRVIMSRLGTKCTSSLSKRYYSNGGREMDKRVDNALLNEV